MKQSCKAANSAQDALRFLDDWIREFKPHFIVTEDAYRAKRKASQVRTIIGALADFADTTKINNAAVARQQRYANKYEEAALLAKEFPKLERILPEKRRLWESEKREMIIFEAVALAKQALPPQ